MECFFYFFSSIFSLISTSLLLVVVALAWYATNNTAKADNAVAAISDNEGISISVKAYSLADYEGAGDYEYTVGSEVNEMVAYGDASTGLVDSTKGVSAIDFIYDGVTIAQASVGEIAAYNFIYNNEAYEKSGTSIYFELSSSENKIVLYFKRELESNEILFKVQYNCELLGK